MAKQTATKRKHADMQKMYALYSGKTVKVGNRHVRKHTDEWIIAKIMHHFYFNNEATVWNILKRKSNHE